MIIGLHTLIYSKDAEKDRAFFRDALGFEHIDAGHGWLIFRVPPAELGIHPTESEPSHELYLMCDNVEKTVAELAEKNVECSAIQEAGFGRMTMIALPGGGRLGLYEPRHPLAIASK